jgi:hypothetical protein
MTEDTSSVPTIPGYRTGRLLGFGACGEVWAAVSEDTEEQVALNVLRGGGRSQDRLASVLRETAVLRRLDHQHVVRLRAVGEAPGFGPVLVLDRAPGGSLGALVAARGPLDVGEVVTVLSPLAAALADLHEMGLVHGDVAPGNVLFDGRGRPLLGDLGLATIIGEPAPDTVHGTPGYADPARLDGAAPGPASDVHGLAAVGWLALTGRAPQPAGERPPLVTVVPGVPTALADVLEAALAVDPAGRPDARELAIRCFDAAPAVPVRLVPTDPAAAAAEVVTHRLRAAAAATPPARVPPRPRRRGRRGGRGTSSRPWASGVLAGAATLVVLAGAAALTPWLLGDGAPTARATTSAGGPGGAGGSGERAEPAAPDAGEVPTAIDAALRGDDPRAAVPALAWLRARAFSTGDPAPLERADAAGGAALADDAARLEALESAGVVLEGLGFDVRSVQVVSRTAADAVVETTVVTMSHRQVGRDGEVMATVARAGERTSRLALRKGETGWQVVHTGG